MHPLLHLAIIWAAVFVAVVAAKKTRLTAALFFLFMGFFLVNIGVLPTESDQFIREFAELGIIFIMFALGFEESTDNFLSSMKKSWGIALFGALGPFLVAYGIAQWAWNDPNLSLMCALAMTATAVSLTMVSLRGEGLQHSAVATRIMTSAVIDDIGSLIAVAILVPLAAGEEQFSAAGVFTTAGKAALFFMIVTIVAAWIFPLEPRGWARRIPFLNTFGIGQFLSFDEGRYSTLAILLVALVVALAAFYFGFHPAVGAYMAGLIVREEYFFARPTTDSPEVQADTRNAYQQTKHIIDDAAFSWIGPVFFVDLGAKLIFDWELLVTVLPTALLLFAGLFIIQVSSAGVAARYTSQMNWHESLMIGFGMLGRAELAFVVMNIAYVQYGIMHREAFFTLMITAFFLNIAVPLCIHWWRPHYQRSVQDSN